MKISMQQYAEWMQLPQPEWSRLGQWFCNHFKIHNTAIFYCLDPNHARSMIIAQYVDAKDPGRTDSPGE